LGGVETFSYNMCKKLSEYYDILLLYRNCDINQLNRLKKYVKCEKYDETKEYNCDKCILASSWGGYPNSIISKEYIQIIHANYQELLKDNYRYVPFNKTTKHIAVSQTVAKHFEEIYNIKCQVVYNILDEIQETQPILKLISATRLSEEKGYKRMVILANELKKSNVKFRWLIFTDLNLYKIPLMQMEEIIYMKPRFDLFEFIKEADYGVQLSKTEGYSYFVNECLQYGTPMITTNFESAFESIKDDFNGYILDMNLSNLNIDKIMERKLKPAKYEIKTKVEDWIEILGKPDKQEIYNYEEEQKMKVEIKIVKSYYDIELQKTIILDELIIVTKERAEYLKSNGVCEIVREIEEEKPRKVKEEIVEDKIEEVKFKETKLKTKKK
jgi:glycosyltransferase involved in cell wall biosynthesis